MSRIKDLQGEIKQLENQLKQVDKARQKVNTQYAAIQEQITAKGKEIKLLTRTSKSITVSDHAFSRYLERHCEFKIDDLKSQIAEKVGGLAGRSLDGRYEIDGIEYVMKDRVVVTII